MGNQERPVLYNRSKRLPIVFCLDVSPSMGMRFGGNRPSIELLNESVKSFVEELREDTTAQASAEIAFVTFSSNIIEDTPFESIKTVTVPEFKPVDDGTTQMAAALMRSIEKIDQRRKQHADMEIPCHAPFLVLVTDGNPDEDTAAEASREAMNALRKHCDPSVRISDVIIPFVVGVGDYIDEKRLNPYASGFAPGYFPVKGNTDRTKESFHEVFNLIKDSTKKSFHPYARASDFITSIRSDMTVMYGDLQQKMRDYYKRMQAD